MLRLVNALWFSLLLSLILIAVYVSLGRHFLSVVTESPAYIEQLLEDALKQPVQVKLVQGHWHFLSPSITLHDVSVGGGGASRSAAPATTQAQSQGERAVPAPQGDPPGKGVRVGFLHLGVDVFRTLLAREVRLSFLHISGLRVSVFAAQGRITRIEGLNLFKSGAVPKPDTTQAPKRSQRFMARVPRLLQNLLADKGLIFKEIQLALHTPNQSQKFRAKQISLVEVSDQYHIQAQLELLEDRPVMLTVHSIMHGQLMAPETWSGRFYVDVDRTPAARWLQHLPGVSGQLHSLDLGGALWGQFQDASLQTLTGRAALYDLDYAPPLEGEATAPAAAPRVTLPYAATQFNWAGELTGSWRMRFQEVLLQTSGGEFRPGPVFVAREVLSADEASDDALAEGGDGNMTARVDDDRPVSSSEPREATATDAPGPDRVDHSTQQTNAAVAAASTGEGVDTRRGFRIQMQKVALAELVTLVQQLGVLPSDTAARLGQAQPVGELARVELRVQPGDEATGLRWSAGLVAESVQWSAVSGVPGLSGASLTVLADESSGVARVSVASGQLDLQPNFREPIPLRQVTLPLRWQQDASGLHVSSGVVRVENEDALGAAMLALTLPTLSKPQPQPQPQPQPSGEKGEQREAAAALAARPRLSLIAGLTRGRDKAAVGRYLPTQNMAPGLVRWLDNSLIAGLLESGHFVHEGPITKFPYAATTFQMRFLVNEATVDYQPPWPMLTQARVDAFINRREGEFLVPYAKAYEATVTQGRVEMPYFERGETPQLNITLKASGDVAQGLRVLRETPLRDQLGEFVDDVVATGDLTVDLSLEVPLRGPNKKAETASAQPPSVSQAPSVTNAPPQAPQQSAPGVQVAVAVDLKAVDLAVPPWQLAVSAINGPLTFKSGQGLASTGLRGQFLEQPVRATIRTGGAAASASNVTKIDVTGQVTASALAAWQRLPILTFLSGETAYQAQVTLFPAERAQGPDGQPVQARPPNVTVRSNLTGLAVDLPAPVGKPTDTSTDLTVSLDFGATRNVTLLAQGVGAMGLRFDSQGLNAVRMHLGADRLMKAQTPGLVMTGDTPQLLLAPWIEFIERYLKRVAVVEATDTAPPGETSESAESGFDWLSELKWVDISANTLGYDAAWVNQATVQVARIADVWQITLQGAEISGIVSLPLQYFESAFLDRLRSGITSARVRERMNARPIDLDIGYLALPAPATRARSQAAPSAWPDYLAGPVPAATEAIAAVSGGGQAAQAQPALLEDGYRRLPPFNLRVRRLFRGGDALGAWSAQVAVTPLGLRVSNVTGRLNAVDFKGQGAWTASLGGPATTLAGRATTANLAASLSGFGFAPVIESADAALDLDLSWQGRPWDFDLLTAEGAIDMGIREGTLLNINSTASTVRVIGLLNIEMLTRRMQLDFTDVLNKGMQFQTLGGKFDLRDGLLLTDHVKLRGASAQFDIAGQISLRAETIDTEMSVTLPVTRNLVLPAAATGGLPAAATAFVIEKALGDTLDKLTTMRFDVSGDWNDPQITRRRRQTTVQDNRPGR